MKLPISPRELTTRRLLVVAYLLVALVTTAAFAQAVTGHLAAMHAPSAEPSVVDYEVTDEGALDVTLHVHNPTMRDLELVSSRVRANVDGELSTVATRTILDGVVPSGETKEVTVRLDFREGGEERFRNAGPEQITMEGTLKVRIVEEIVSVQIEGMEATA